MAIYNKDYVLEATREKKEWQKSNVTQKSKEKLEKQISNTSTKTLQRNMSQIKNQTFRDKFDNPSGSTKETIRNEDDKTIQNRVSSNSYKGSIIGKELKSRGEFQDHLHYGQKERKDPDQRKDQTKEEQDYADKYARKRPNNTESKNESTILNEVYFGKGPIAPMQAQFSKLRAKLKNKPVTSSTNLDPEILKFNRIVEKTFGFSNFALYIQPDHMPNAYTFGVETFYSDEEKEKLRRSIIANPTGFKFDTKHMQVSLIAAINSGLLDLERITDEEIIAVLLHEIYHGFYEAVCMVEPAPSKVRSLVDLLNGINNLIISRISNGKQLITSEIEKEVNNILPRLVNRVKNTFKNIFFKKRGTVSEAMSDNLTRKMVAYTNEKFADTGVAMYGYSEELHHCLLHMFDDYYEEMSKKQKKYPRIYEIYKMWDYYLTDGLLYLLGLQDEHPTELTRISTSIQYIKRELAKEGIDPKMKRELLSQLEACQEMIDTYLSIPRDEDSMRIARMYYIKLWEKFGGDRREQDADNDAFFKQIDDRYRELAGK